MGLLSPFGLIRANATVDIEAPTVVVTGGTTVTWAATASAVPVLITLAGGNRGGQTGGDFQRDAYTVTGTNGVLARTDVRLKVVSCPNLPELVGDYLRVDSAVTHPRSQFGLVGGRVTVRASRLQVPGNDL